MLLRCSLPVILRLTGAQVRFILGSATCFSRKDTVSDSEKFYFSVYEFLTAPEERQNVAELLQWWDKYVQFVDGLTLLDVHASRIC